jgi:hypothetical protein
LTTAAVFPGGQPFGCGAAVGFEAAVAGADAAGFGADGGAGGGGATTLAADGGGCGGTAGLTTAVGGGDGGGVAGFRVAGGAAWGGAIRAAGTCGGGDAGFAIPGDEGVIGFGGVDDAGSFAVGACAGGFAPLPAGADGVTGLVAVGGGPGDSFAAGACNGPFGFAPAPAGGVGNAWPAPGAVDVGVPGVTAADGVVVAIGLDAGAWGDGVPGFVVDVGEEEPAPGAIAADGAAGGTTTPFADGKGLPPVPGSGWPG